jgi:hypothetical protein
MVAHQRMVGPVELQEAALGGNDASFNHLCRTIATVCTRKKPNNRRDLDLIGITASNQKSLQGI